jgi:hypothetical protein
MENALKQDVLNEIRRGDGRLLLHDEVEVKPGQFEIIPIWETLSEKDIMTPRELYDGVMRENYQVDYLRVAIVSSFFFVQDQRDKLTVADGRASTSP